MQNISLFLVKTLKRVGMSVALTTSVLGIMWVTYFFVNVIAGTTGMGVHPRNVGFSEAVGVLSSWMYHGSWNHIISNSMGLLILLPYIGFFEKNPFRVTFALALLSGFFTWVLGAANTNHIGASGLIFAMMGYVLAAGTIGLKFRYIIPVVLSGASYWYSIKNGLIPQDSISFAGHFGGLLAGLILGFFIPKAQREEESKNESIMSQYPMYGTLKTEKKWYHFWKKEPAKIDWKKESEKMKAEQLEQLAALNKKKSHKAK